MIANSAHILRAIEAIRRSHKLILFKSERSVFKCVPNRHLLKVDRASFNRIHACEYAAHIPCHVCESEMGHVRKGDPICLSDFIMHLNIDCLVAVFGLKEADNVEVLLAPLVFEQLSEAQDAHEVCLDTSLFPHFSFHGIFDRLTGLDETTRQFPKWAKISRRLPFLNTQQLRPIIVQNEATHTNIVAGEARHFILGLREPLSQHKVVFFGVMEIEASVLHGHTCKVSMLFFELEPDASETIRFVGSDGVLEESLEFRGARGGGDQVVGYTDAIISINMTR